jgi:tetratricopeptide (TPR) repeat protein
LENLHAVLDDPQRRPLAHLEIGDCLSCMKEFPKALQSYRIAADAASETDQAMFQKMALYRAGMLATEIRLVVSAKRYFTALLRLDPVYRDAAERLEKVNRMDE